MVGRPEAHTGPEEEEEVGQRSEREMGFGLSSTTSAVHHTADQKINSEPLDV